MYDLTDKVALVTGASSRRGFGRAIANRLAREGADVVIVSRSTISSHDKDFTADWKGMDSIVAEIAAFGRKALAITCDITKSDEVVRMVNETIANFNHIDILVNNAGIHLFGKIESITDEIWNRTILVNLTGTFFCSRAVIREMVRRNKGGRIINIASVSGKQGNGQGDIPYCASKFGMIGITQSLALELAQYKINVNAVCPTIADTDLAIEHFREEATTEGTTTEDIIKQLYSRFSSTIPLGRLVTTEDVANVVAFLSSKEADFITGQSINVDGGLLVAH